MIKSFFANKSSLTTSRVDTEQKNATFRRLSPSSGGLIVREDPTASSCRETFRFYRSPCRRCSNISTWKQENCQACSGIKQLFIIFKCRSQFSLYILFKLNMYNFCCLHSYLILLTAHVLLQYTTVGTINTYTTSTIPFQGSPVSRM